jgi:hypothetical protein
MRNIYGFVIFGILAHPGIEAIIFLATLFYSNGKPLSGLKIFLIIS